MTLDGDVVAGGDSKLTLTVAKDGKPVTDLQPYLAAYGHLVALREGDLAYLHVHPDGEPGDGKTKPGPGITFHADVPVRGQLPALPRLQARRCRPYGRVHRRGRGGHRGARATTTATPSTSTDMALTDQHPTTDRIDLSIGGMTCASCAMRIEKRLNKLDGVTASVNYATEKARVDATGPIDPELLIAEVEKAGYTAQLPQPPRTEQADEVEDDPSRPLLNRLLISIVLTVPVIAIAMIPALQFTNWQWLSLTLAAPVVVWGALPFHVAAWTNLRHGAATMDTLISVGTLAAFGWSLYALFWGTAGEPGMKHPFELTISRMDGSGNIYFEAAAGVTTFLLAGRYFEARVQAARRLGAARPARARRQGGLGRTRRGRGPHPHRRPARRRPLRRTPGREDRHGRRDRGRVRPRSTRRW